MDQFPDRNPWPKDFQRGAADKSNQGSIFCNASNGLGYEICVFTEPSTGSQIVVLVNATNQNADVPADITQEILDTLGWPH